MTRCHNLALLLLLLVQPGGALRLQAAEFFVSTSGDDAHAGTSPETAFVTVQKGVDALQPGDTLTIAPGEYLEGVKRADLGNLERETVIRAELPGTVTLRGDVLAPPFVKLPGKRFVYVADFTHAGPIPAVNEIDTLSILKRMPNADELEFIPGAFYYHAAARKLYVSTSDLRPVEAHRYSVSVVPRHGLHLIRPRRVTVEGLTFTGFSAMELLHYREETAGGTWGAFLVNGKSCTVRDCRAYLNAWGIGLNSSAKDSGDNVIDRCAAWGNKSAFANGDMGGLTIFAARRDTIRRSTAYRNGMYGVNIYGTGGAPPNADDGGNDPQHKSLLESNLSWGNETADIKIKTGYEYHHVAKNCVASGLWSVNNIVHGTIGRATASHRSEPGHIHLDATPPIDLHAEFADPDNYDYRLQSTSRFRGQGTGVTDRGAFPFAPNVYFVAPQGNDSADGLAISAAWKTLSRALRNLKAGDTLYLEPGEYAEELELRAAGTADAPITIRGRGVAPVVVRGAVRFEDCQHVSLQRLQFAAEVAVTKSRDVALAHCEFMSGGTSLRASGLVGLTIEQGLFSGAQSAALELNDCQQVDLRGNAFVSAAAPAVKVKDLQAIQYANYNGYVQPAAVWEVGGKTWSLAEVQAHHDQQSRQLSDVKDPVARSGELAAGGPFGKPLGPFRDVPPRNELRLAAGPTVHSVSATTANLEWTTSLPATCHLAWGDSPSCEQTAKFDVNCFGTYSLTGLEPGRTYYFRIAKLETPSDLLPKGTIQSVPLHGEPVAFTTLTKNAPPKVYHVATDGDDAASGEDRRQAWRTIRRAAAQVNVGDTVLVAGGLYNERVRIRATGETDLPISFRAAPGERVELHGDHLTLNSAFVAGGKSHLRFDGFYLSQFNLFPNDRWSLVNSGEFHLYGGRDIEISRCFSEGRGGYTALPVSAYHVQGLTIRNCVNTFKFGGMYFWRCPNLVLENTVFVEPMIMAFVLRNEKQQAATMRNCIFTDMLEKKAKINLAVLCCDGAIEGYRNISSGIFLRDCIPLAERALVGSFTAEQPNPHMIDPLFADPQFAGDPGAKGNPQDKSGFSPDRMLDLNFRLDFDSFFATNPEYVRRGIGLQPEAFHGFPLLPSSPTGGK